MSGNALENRYMMRKKEVRLVAFNNDAISLLVSGFDFPLARCKFSSSRTQSISVLEERSAYLVRGRGITEILSRSPKRQVYFKLEDMLKGFPKDFSPKIENVIALYEEEGEIFVLRWERDTIHKSLLVTDDSYQKWTLNRILEAWNIISKSDVNGFPNLKEFRPSILVLESIRPFSNPKLEIVDYHEKEQYEDLLYRILSYLRSNGGHLAEVMYDVVYRIEVKRGVKEYVPYRR